MAAAAAAAVVVVEDEGQEAIIAVGPAAAVLDPEEQQQQQQQQQEEDEGQEEEEEDEAEALAAAIALSLAPERPPPLEEYLEAGAPDELVCPITLLLLLEPVFLVADGITYSKAAIQEHLDCCRDRAWDRGGEGRVGVGV